MRSTDILIVDDEIGIREVLQETLEDEGYSVSLAENAEEARQLRRKAEPALVLLDIWMPDSDGVSLLKEWATNGLLTMPVVMMSGHGSIDTAVEAIKIGAFDYLEKPITLQKLLDVVARAFKHKENQNKVPDTARFGNSPAIQEMAKHLEKALSCNGSVLLLGETGSPFEAVAKMFRHEGKPWVEPVKAEHIAEMPLELLNNANGGVLYLGDIAQYGKNILGSIGILLEKSVRHHIRIVCASSVPLHQLLEGGCHDARLNNLLSTLLIHLPPLRRQSEDIPLLLEQILHELSDEYQHVRFSRSAVAKLCQYHWPGNLEQLRSVVKSLVFNAESSEVSDGDVVEILSQFGGEEKTADEVKSGFNFNLPLRELREELERAYFEYHIRQENHNMSRVAQRVGLERTHLYRKLKQLGITFTRRSGESVR